jgi:ATP-dependent helicase/nuclease subunit A
VRALLRETNFLELSLLQPHGEQRVLNLNKILQRAQSFEKGNLSYRRFARWIGEQKAATSAEAESPLVEEDEDAVRLLTVHKAKGLQFPVVIMANLVQKRSFRGGSVLGREGLLSIRIAGELKNSEFEELRKGERAREEAENARLLYVAATRAGDLLVIPRSRSGKSSYFHLISDGLAEGSRHIENMKLSDLPEIDWRFEPFRKKPRIGGAEDLEEWLAGRNSLLDRAARCPAIITPSGTVDHEMFSGDSLSETEGEGASFGIAFHELMELIDMGSVRAPAELCASVAAKYRLRDADELRVIADRALDSKLISEIRASRRFYREIPFTLGLGGDYAEGRMDLIYEREDGWRIVDYKTDDMHPDLIDQRFDAYRPQGLLYALAASKVGIGPISDVVFYFARSGESRTIDISRELLEEYEAGLGSSSRADA